MTNQTTNSQAGRVRRYSVSRLLELAPHARPASFDLSKFTYDAARGVVPPLGACAMSSRRASSDRPRGWSQESGSSQDEIIVYRRNRIVKEPERQPKIPPAEDRAQQDEGFARFLKKHSSPTHQRVTAGGRIVPMEQRQRPPLFSLTQSKQTIEPAQEDEQHEAVNGDIQDFKAEPAGQPKAKGDLTDNPNIQHLHAPQISANAGFVDASTIPTGINANLMTTSDTYAIDAVAAQPGYMPLTMSPFYGPAYGDSYMLSPQMVAGNTVALASPLAPFSSPVGATFPMPLVPSQEMFGLPDAGEVPMTPITARLPDGSYDRHMLINAISLFEDLDRQLKSLDRHRAMSNRDSYVAEQRMAIVQLRSEAKTQITFWTDKLGLDPKALPKSLVGAGSSTLNVKAAAYVPMKTVPTQEPFSTNFGSALKANDEGLQAEKPKFTFKGGRHAIPIVPPPEKSSSPQKIGKDEAAEAASKAGAVEVDEWGVRMDPRPPEIARQQNEMLERLVREASISPHESSDNIAIVSTPGPSSQSISPVEQPGNIHQPNGTELLSESAEWLPTNPGRAPPTVEASYELQLDAMRLPHGLISKIKLPDGTITEVRGRGLQRPPSFEMDDFEKRYWTTKPVVTKEMTRKFVEVRLCSEDALSEQLAEYIDLDCLASTNGVRLKDRAKEGLSSSGSESSNGFSGSSKQLRNGGLNTGDLSRPFGRKAYTSTAGPSTSSDPSMSTFKQSTASSPQFWPRGEDKTGWLATDHSRNGRDVSFDAVNNNKGFSSVSVQNVHAMGRLPHMMDGTADSQRRSAKSMLSAAGKALSPQLMQGSVSPPLPAYVPYRQEARGILVESDDVFRPRVTKEENL